MFSKMYKGLRFAVLSRIVDSGTAPKAYLNGITTLRSYSGKMRRNNSSQEATRVIPFSDYIESRLSEARRSLLLEVKTEKNLKQLFTICEKYGEIEKVFRCELSDGRKTVLLEMKDSHCTDLFEHITYNGPTGTPEMYSPFVKADFNSIVVMQTTFKPSLVLETSRNQESSSQKNTLWSLYNDWTINDFDMRLRFLVVSQFQTILSGLWKNARVVPFGGSVNGFGNRSSDLDMTVLFEDPQNMGFITFKHDEKRDINEYHNHCFQIISALIKLSMPGCKYVVPIPGAKVPIVKFFHTYVDLECDLSVQSTDGLLSTELMYYMAHLHHLVKPLAFVLKRWAKDLNLICGNPGKTITNFGLLCMVIFFLQQKGNSSVLLPPFAEFEIEGDMKKPFVWERCQAVNRIKSSQVNKEPAENLDEILYKFFDYYSKFDFSVNGICTRTGKVIPNSKRIPLLIVNALNENWNITKQVNEKEIEKIKAYCYVAKKLFEKRKYFTEDLFNINFYLGKEKMVRNDVNDNYKKVKENLRKKATTL